VADIRYDFSLNLITRNRQQTKQIVVGWCEDHGLYNAKIREVTEENGWSSYQLFSSYLDMKNYVALNNADPKRAFEELLQTLKKVDEKIRIRTNWQNLECYIALEQEALELKNKVKQLEVEMCREEDKLIKEAVTHETQNFDVDEEIMNSGTQSQIARHFKHP
jgi:hypothetical protein